MSFENFEPRKMIRQLPGKQLGALTMISALLILILLTELIIYAVQAGIFEQRKSSNDMRQKTAFHIADSGIQLGKEFMIANARLISSGDDDVLPNGSDGWLPGSSDTHWRPCSDATWTVDDKGSHPCYGEPADNSTDFPADLRSNMYFYMSDPSGNPDNLSLAELPVDTSVVLDGTHRLSTYALLCMLDIDRTQDPIVQGCTQTVAADPDNVQNGEQDYRYFMVTLLARGEADCDVGRACTAQALVADRIGSFGPGGGDGGPGAPLVTKSVLPITSSVDIVPNPNGGGVGVPISVWFDSSVWIAGTHGSWHTCEAHEFYEVDAMPTDFTCPDPSGVCTCHGKKQLSYPLPAGEQHLGIDMVPDDNFPPDLFKYIFGVPGDAAGVDYVKSLAEEILPGCDDLDGDSHGLIWVTGECDMNQHQVGSPGSPVFLVMAGTGNDITGSPNIYGTVMVTEAVNSPNGIDGRGNPTIYGAMIADGDIAGFQGNLKLVYVEDILETVLGSGKFGTIAGAWTDFHLDWR